MILNADSSGEGTDLRSGFLFIGGNFSCRKTPTCYNVSHEIEKVSKRRGGESSGAA